MTKKKRHPHVLTGPRLESTERTSERLHRDSYADVGAREEELGVTASTHTERSDRRLEEPSEAATAAFERADDA